MNKLLLSACLLSTALVAQRGNQGGEDPWKTLAKYDENENGEVTADEYPRGERGFKNLDRDGNGVITKADFEAMGGRGGRGGRNSRGGGGGRRDMSTMIAGMLAAKADGDQNGEVTLAEWNTHLSSVDKDGDGILGSEEMSGELRMGGGRAQRGGATRMLRRLDKDGDGDIQVGEVSGLFATLDADQDEVLSETELPRRRERGGGGRERAGGRGERQSVGAPAVGDAAPDFDLPLVKDAETTVKLSSFKGAKPVALIFGSYT